MAAFHPKVLFWRELGSPKAVYLEGCSMMRKWSNLRLSCGGLEVAGSLSSGRLPRGRRTHWFRQPERAVWSWHWPVFGNVSWGKVRARMLQRWTQLPFIGGPGPLQVESHHLHFALQEDEAPTGQSHTHNPKAPAGVFRAGPLACTRAEGGPYTTALPEGSAARLADAPRWLWFLEARHGGGGEKAGGPRAARCRCRTVASAAIWPLHALGHGRASWTWPGSWDGLSPYVEGEAWGQERPRGLTRAGMEGRLRAAAIPYRWSRMPRTGGGATEGLAGMVSRQLTKNFDR